MKSYWWGLIGLEVFILLLVPYVEVGWWRVVFSFSPEYVSEILIIGFITGFTLYALDRDEQ